MELVSETLAPEVSSGPRFGRAYKGTCDVDLTEMGTFTAGQPYAAFAQLRREAPVYWHEERLPEPGFWVVTRYEDVMAVNRDAGAFSSQRGGIHLWRPAEEKRHPLLFGASFNNMICLDPPWHVQLRREHMPFFTSAYLATLKARVAAEVDRLLDGMATLGACDLVEHVSAPLPLFTICEVLGVPVADRPKFLRWIHYLELAVNLGAQRSKLTGPPDRELQQFIEAFNFGMEDMFAYGRDILKKRRANPEADMLSAIAHARIDGALLSDQYLDGAWLLMVHAGNETTRHTISGAMKLLTEFPEERRKLMADPSLMPNAVEELIRMISPVIYMRRTATRDVELAGQMIAEGEKVVMYYGAANRDEAVFPDPDRLDLARANADRHLAFGHGPHICLGKRVAQIQLEAVYERIFARFPDVHYAGGIEIEPNNFVLTIGKLPVEFTPERQAN